MALENVAIKKRVFKRPQKEGLLALFSLGLILTSLLFNTPMETLRGFLTIVTSKSNLITDYMALANPGAAFFNAGIISLSSLVLIRRSGAHISGATLAAFFTMTGFAFFGKNIFNSVPITLGAYLYSVINRAKFNSVILSAFYATGLSPLVSEIAFAMDLPVFQGVALAYGIGLLIGLIFPILSSRFLQFHAGYNLYNGGFTAGVIGMMLVGILRMFGLEIFTVDMISREYHRQLFFVLMGIFAVFLIMGLYQQKWSFKEYGELMKHSGRLVTDFTFFHGFGLTLINMAIMGIIATSYVVISGGTINGPTIGGIFTVVGFSAFGKHPKNTLPILAGVYIALLLNIYDPSSTTSTLGALFGTTLAPIAGQYGLIPGVITGFFHAAIVGNVGYLHAGVNLYNNGFSGGFIAATLHPLFEKIEEVLS